MSKKTKDKGAEKESIFAFIAKKRAEKKELIGGYTRSDYKAALDALDPPEDDFFGRHSFTELQSTLIAVIKALVYIVFIISCAAFLAYFGISCANDMFAFVKDDEVVEIVIPDYATSDEIAELLGEAEIIKYPWLFSLYADLKGVDTDPAYDFKGGSYTISKNMNYDSIMRTFVGYATLETVWITIPEGSTVDEIVNIFVSKGCGTKEGFKQVLENYDFAAEFDFLKDIDMTNRYYLIEGYLYPDTYSFYAGRSEDYYLRKLLQQFDKICTRSKLKENAEELGITLDELLTIASIIEKEVYYKIDIDLVSSVIWNRLHDPDAYPYIECDSTIVYALSCEAGERVTVIPDNLTQIDTPYNTYMYKGLPPGPICNSGYDAISCAVDPADTEYFFFASDSAGVMYYAETYEKHKENLEMIKNGTEPN